MNSQIIQKNYLHLCLFVPAKFDNSKKIGWKLRFKILIQDHKLQVILILYYNFFIDVYTVSTLITHEKKKYRKYFLWQSWQKWIGEDVQNLNFTTKITWLSNNFYFYTFKNKSSVIPEKRGISEEEKKRRKTKP